MKILTITYTFYRNHFFISYLSDQHRTAFYGFTINQNGTGGVVTIAITTDTMRLAGAGTTGSRTLARNGVATAIKITATEWIISGTGLT